MYRVSQYCFPLICVDMICNSISPRNAKEEVRVNSEPKGHTQHSAINATSILDTQICIVLVDIAFH